MYHISQIKIVATLVFFVLFFVAIPVFAAEIFFDAKTTRAQIGEKFEVNLFVNAEQESINALEGKIIFPSDILALKEIRDGNTIVNFWVEKPSIPRIATNELTNSNEIIFSGIIPGGYSGNQGLIFSLIFEVKNEGEGTIEIKDAKALLNDGKGTPAILSISHFPFVAIRTPIRGDSWVSPKDTERPESFVPEIAKDETLFDGKWFVVFATQDKASGISGYAVHESRRMKTRIATNAWVEAESPYVLKDQKLRSFIYVKAIDKSGNERIAVVEPRYPIKWYEVWWTWFIVGLGIIAAYFISRILWIKKLQRR